MQHLLAHRVVRSMQATPAAVDIKSTQRLEHKNSDSPPKESLSERSA